MPDVVDEILAAMPTSDHSEGRSWAIVSQASPLRVTFPGDTSDVPMKRMAAYSPSAGDVALLVRFGRRWYAIGAAA